MADTLVEALAFDNTDQANALWGPYYIDVDTAVIVFMDEGDDISFARTTDKGASWATTEIGSGLAKQLACWFDRETPGDTGTLIHVTWLQATGTDRADYRTIDISDGSLGTQRTVDTGLTVSASVFNNRIAITKTVNGNIIVALSTPTEVECWKSADNFATAPTAIADVFETGTEMDWVLLFPADVDAGDAAALFWDRSADELTLKMYDDSADTWTETTILAGTAAVDDTAHINMNGSVRHSDKKVLIAFHNNDDDGGDDLLTFELAVNSIASPTVTAKTNIFTNQGESAQVSVHINQQNDDVRVAYLKGGTWAATVDVVFHLSENGMGSWGSEQAYSESAADDFRVVSDGRTTGDDGGRYQPAFYDDDETEIFINEVNDTEIAAAAAAGSLPAHRASRSKLHMLGR